MLQLPYANEYLPQLAREMAALGLPGFLGVAKLSREIDRNGRAVLVDGKPKTVAAYLLVKSDPLSAAQRTAATAVVSAHVPALKQERAAKRRAFVEQAVARTAAQVPDWDTIETIKSAAGAWPALAASGGITAEMLLAKDIYLYVKNTVPPKLAAAATQAGLDAIDPTAADPFGDGTPWPT